MTKVFIALFRLLSRSLALLGPKRCISIGRAIGVFAFYCVPIRRKMVLANLARAFPEKTVAERRAIARGCYRQLGRVFMEVIFMPSLTNEQVNKFVRLRNEELLHKCFAENKGLIFCMAHMGNWEMLGYAGFTHGFDVYAITRKLTGAFNEFLHSTRAKLFKELPGKNSLDMALKALATNAGVAQIIDQHHAGRHPVMVEFFGRPAAATGAPAVLNLRSGAPVVTGWMTIGEDDCYDIWVRGPYPVPEGETVEERVQLHTQWLARDLEAVIRERPSEWFWVHRRWKVPDDTPVPLRDVKIELPPLPDIRTKAVA